MKKAVGLLVVLFIAAFLPAVSANQNPSIVVIDTAIDTAAPSLSGKVIHEVCVMETNRCPNNSSFMEGPGSASLPTSDIYRNGFDHGTVMSSIALQTNPNMSIVFIRVVPMTANKTKGIYTDRSIDMALDWVIANKDKFNIVAVSASIGHHAFRSFTNYCPVRQTLQQDIIKLQSIGVGTFLAAGNDYDYVRVDYPACIPQALAVGSVDKTERISLYSNGGADIDFYTLGDYNVLNKRVVGTSAATAAFAAYWVKSYAGSYQSTYDYLKSIAKPAENTKVKTTMYVNTLG